jgi:hypothetical protein
VLEELIENAYDEIEAAERSEIEARKGAGTEPAQDAQDRPFDSV